MRRELRIHVGLPKTGTSALQRLLFDSRDYLDGLKVYYPPDVIEYRHQRLVVGLMSELDPSLVATFLPRADVGQTTVWSAEGFSHNLYRFQEKNLNSLIEATRDCERRIFLVVRQREKFLWSLYKQCLINPVLPSVSYYGQDIPFQDFIELPYIRKLADFDQVSEDLRSGFRAEVTVLDYDAMDLARIFERVAGVAMPVGVTVQRVNASFPDMAIDEIRRANATLAGHERDEGIVRILRNYAARDRPAVAQ
jgi:hypothetical protein